MSWEHVGALSFKGSIVYPSSASVPEYCGDVEYEKCSSVDDFISPDQSVPRI